MRSMRNGADSRRKISRESSDSLCQRLWIYGTVSGKDRRRREICGDFEVKLYDMVTASKDEVLGEIAGADGILFGTPTILQEALNPIWDLTINMYPPVHNGKYAAAFGSYGWSGEAVPHLTERLKRWV